MKKNFKIYIPIIITVLICLILIGLFLYYQITNPHDGPENLAGKAREREDEGGIFKLMGNGAILAGALSFSWFLLKKKLKSPFPIVKVGARKAHSLHTYTGWAALALVVIHGGYYLIKEFTKTDNLTGASAFLLLLCLAIYGYVLDRKKKKPIRSAHFVLSILWIAAVLVHGGGFAVGTGVTMAVLYIGVTWLERKNLKPAGAK
ncbi:MULTISPECIES: hypothetical protein [Neobacillus]|uniref:Uncharacterized protein n=1 Tax=Neobacillus citreus TaxID=2833578 RepID=A0A942T877_9BACI|nr:hypothetical protein [Neobacillus citreus]MCH6267341.1 hypothetical protein [Neobacillus citreus]